jgi:SNF2 family DNA or RNA helicase
MEYQYRALGKIEKSNIGPLKALLLADPPGLGKTLPAMMAVVKAIPTARRFSIIVAPSSCMEQWENEFKRFFVPVSPLSPRLQIVWTLT